MNIKSWTDFLINSRDLCHHRLTFPRRQRYGDIKGLVDDVIDKLLEPGSVEAVRHAAEDMETDPDEKLIIEYLERELEFFNDLIRSYRPRRDELHEGEGETNDETREPGEESELTASLYMTEEEADDAIETGAAIKESFEKLIRMLPRWIRKILEILNEIFKIIKVV